MPNQLTRALGAFVNYPAFRRDAATFLSLPRGAVDRLVSLVEKHASFDIPPHDLDEFEKACDLTGKGRQVLGVAHVIRSAVQDIERQETRDQDLIDFASLVKVEAFTPEHFSGFFSPLPQLEKEDVRSTAIALAPTIVDTRLYSDLRVIHQASGLDWALVPVVVARLGFDEPVAGQQALFVQLTEESLAELKQQVERVEKTLQAIRDRLGNQIITGKKSDKDDRRKVDETE